MIKSACYPVKESVTSAKCEALLKELAECGLILVYQVDGKPYLQVCKWDNAPRSKESKYPQPDDTCIQVHADVCNPHTVLPGTGTVTVTKTETETASPRKRSKPDGFTPPDWINREHWDAWHSCSKRRNSTPAQKQLAVDKLQRWREAGQDHAGALENAAVGGWQGLFLPDAQKAAKQSFAQQAADVARTTVPARKGKDPALAKIEADMASAAPPSLEVLERMAKLRAAA
jgi:hypothetical protein